MDRGVGLKFSYVSQKKRHHDEHDKPPPSRARDGQGGKGAGGGEGRREGGREGGREFFYFFFASGRLAYPVVFFAPAGLESTQGDFGLDEMGIT